MTAAEQAELESMVRANTLLGVLKTEAHAFLAHAKPQSRKGEKTTMQHLVDLCAIALPFPGRHRRNCGAGRGQPFPEFAPATGRQTGKGAGAADRRLRP